MKADAEPQTPCEHEGRGEHRAVDEGDGGDERAAAHGSDSSKPGDRRFTPRVDSRVDPVAERWQPPQMRSAILPSPVVLKSFCMDRGIRRLSLFGSAAREDFDPARSDVDLLVEYEAGRHPGLDHFRVAEELSELFGRKVDLNTPAMLGRYLAGVSEDIKLLYAKA